ncbi:MAG: hypothetical protein Q9162_005632 [Coniocarpon cinnabarinum]
MGESSNLIGLGMPLDRCPNLILVGNTAKGRGVFARGPIPARTIIERCPVLVLDPQENTDHVSQTNIYDYTYNWLLGTCQTQTQALPLGLGSLFNHSNHPRRCNVGWTRNIDPETRLVQGMGVQQGHDSITYVTLRAVEIGEELCISYGPKERLTFVDVEEQDVDRARTEPDEEHAMTVLGSVTLGLDDD